MAFSLQSTFSHAASRLHAVSDAYDYFGLLIYRALFDRTFFDYDPQDVKNPVLRFGASHLESASQLAQDVTYNAIMSKGAHGDFSPRSYVQLARRILPLVAAVEMSPAFVTAAASLFTVSFVLHSLGQGHTGYGGLVHAHGATLDMMGNWLGSNMPVDRKNAPIAPSPVMPP